MTQDKEIGCYILYSKKINKYYVGVCQENLSDRIQKHNSGFYGMKSYTIIANDWALYLSIPTKTYSMALAVERKINSMKSRRYIENLSKYPEMIEKIIKSL